MYEGYFGVVGREWIGCAVETVLKGSGEKIQGKLTDVQPEFRLMFIEGEGHKILVDIAEVAAFRITGAKQLT
jgi:hypothetical protein